MLEFKWQCKWENSSVLRLWKTQSLLIHEVVYLPALLSIELHYACGVNSQVKIFDIRYKHPFPTLHLKPIFMYFKCFILKIHNIFI